MTVQDRESEVKALRKAIRRLADEAEWALKQEGESIHGHCEGHAVCDLVHSALYAARQIEAGDL